MERDAVRAGYLTGLSAEAERRFGAARAETIKKTIDDTATWMAEIAAFPVDPDEAPAFYAEDAS